MSIGDRVITPYGPGVLTAICGPIYLVRTHMGDLEVQEPYSREELIYV